MSLTRLAELLATPARGWGYDEGGRLYTAAAPPRVMALPARLRVVSWNIAYGYGPGSEAHDYVPRPRSHFQARLGRMAATLAGLDADLVLLQEVDFRARRSHGEDQLTFLQGATGLPYAAAAVGWSVRYVPYPAWPPSRHVGPVVSGGAVLSRFPVLGPQQVHHHPPPAANPGWYNAFYLRRYTQTVTLDVGGGRRLVVLNSHLEDADAAARAGEAAFVAAAARSALAAGRLLLVGGDLNGGPADPALRPLSEVTGLAAAFPEGAPPTFPSPTPRVRLDHLYAGPGLRVTIAMAALGESPAIGSVFDSKRGSSFAA